MFSSIRNLWREARGTQLRKEFEDAILKINSLGSEVNSRCLGALIISHERILREYGPMENISSKGAITIADSLKGLARKSFDLDMGKGYGYFFAAAYFESSALPGDDAKFVFSMTSGLLQSIETEMQKSYREYLDDNKQENVEKIELAKQVIEVGKKYGAVSARDAAEMVMGRKFLDSEWDEIKGDWEPYW